MKASQLLKPANISNCITLKAKSHYKELMKLGRCLPSTPSQAKFFVSNEIRLDILNSRDVLMVETILNKHGYEGDYKFTKSTKWVRLQNNDDLIKAVQLEFNF